jgi:Protein of unknown function (DUF2726)
MNTSTWFLIVFFAVGAFLWLQQRRTNSGKSSRFAPQDWQPKATRPLTLSELQLMARLKQAAPECFVLPQVSLSRFINVRQNQSYSQWFQRVGRRCVDFLLCSDKGDVLAVIELTKTSPREPSKRRSQGQEYKDRTLKIASVPVWRFSADTVPSLGKLRELILTELSASIAHTSEARGMHNADTAVKQGGIEVLELSDSRWKQDWPSADNRPSAYLDDLEPASAPAPLWMDPFSRPKRSVR